MRLGSIPLLEFQRKGFTMQAILDSGTSCLVLPDDEFDGGLKESPFRIFEKYWATLDDPSIYMYPPPPPPPTQLKILTPRSKIGGHEFEFDYRDFMVNGQPCVMRMPSQRRTFLLGDVFFRRMVVHHDLSDLKAPTVTLARRNEGYSLATAPLFVAPPNGSAHTAAVGSHRVPLAKGLPPQGGQRRLLTFDRLPLTTANSYMYGGGGGGIGQCCRYYAQLSVGTPRQSDLHVIVDTVWLQRAHANRGRAQVCSLCSRYRTAGRA
jgi:hypothetical protein